MRFSVDYVLSQTLARIGAGLTAFAFWTWFLWPTGEQWKPEPEPFFVFAVAFFVWIATEFKKSEEVIFRVSTPNDIRVAREILEYSVFVLREALKDHDYSRGLQPRFSREITAYTFQIELGVIEFQDSIVQAQFKKFSDSLLAFDSYFSSKSSPEQIGQVTLQSIVTAEHYNDWDIPDRFKPEIAETHRLAKNAWKDLEALVSLIKSRIPEALDEVIMGKFLRTQDDERW